MKKIACSLGIASSLLFTGMSVHAAGTGDDPAFTKDIKTEAQQKTFEEKEAAINNRANIMSGVYKTISVPSYQQETNYWCGPATVKQVLGFLKGSSSSQKTYAKELGTTRDGTDFTLIDNVLNKHQSKNRYVYANIGNYTSWTKKVNYALDRKYPAVLDMKISPSYMPKYTSSVEGHILNVSGIDTKKSTPQVRLTDPFDQGNRGVTLGNVWHPQKGVYNSNNAHFRKAMQY